MLKISHANCLGLSSGISSQFTLEMCAAAKNCENFTKTPFVRVQGRLRSSVSINLKSLLLVIYACLYLSATVFMLHEPIAANFLNGTFLFDAFV